jgi:hydrogenase-4 membrane subunit HyfE
MTLRIRKLIVIGIIGVIFMAGNIIVIANWLAAKGIPEKATWIRENFLTGTAITVIIALLILLVNPARNENNISQRRCPVCDKKISGNSNYCCECGCKVA